jgi:hypothetical protein
VLANSQLDRFLQCRSGGGEVASEDFGFAEQDERTGTPRARGRLQLDSSLRGGVHARDTSKSQRGAHDRQRRLERGRPVGHVPVPVPESRRLSEPDGTIALTGEPRHPGRRDRERRMAFDLGVAESGQPAPHRVDLAVFDHRQPLGGHHLSRRVDVPTCLGVGHGAPEQAVIAIPLIGAPMQLADDVGIAAA